MLFKDRVPLHEIQSEIGSCTHYVHAWRLRDGKSIAFPKSFLKPTNIGMFQNQTKTFRLLAFSCCPWKLWFSWNHHWIEPSVWRSVLQDSIHRPLRGLNTDKRNRCEHGCDRMKQPYCNFLQDLSMCWSVILISYDFFSSKLFFFFCKLCQFDFLNNKAMAWKSGLDMPFYTEMFFGLGISAT